MLAWLTQLNAEGPQGGAEVAEGRPIGGDVVVDKERRTAGSWASISFGRLSFDGPKVVGCVPK
jgi:hypothetical protein